MEMSGFGDDYDLLRCGMCKLFYEIILILVFRGRGGLRG